MNWGLAVVRLDVSLLLQAVESVERMRTLLILKSVEHFDQIKPRIPGIRDNILAAKLCVQKSLPANDVLCPSSIDH